MSTRLLAVGEDAHIPNDGTIEQWPVADVTSTTAWRKRLLVLTNTRLPEVVAELARYNATTRRGDVIAMLILIRRVGETVEVR